MAGNRSPSPGGREQKLPPEEISKKLGFVDTADFKRRAHMVPGFDPEAFIPLAFPEFPADAYQIADLRGNRMSMFDLVWPVHLSIEAYVAAYEATYRHHYAMQDDWLALEANPDLGQFVEPGYAAEMDRRKPGWRAEPLPFELFELAMLCVADDDYWKARVRDIAGDPLYSQWIIEWRVRLGTYDPGIDGPWRAAVWRHNWREVRDAVVAINAKEYPAHHFYEEQKEEYTADELPESGVLALARGLVEERELRPHEGETAAQRVDRAAGEIFRLSTTSWHQHVIARSGYEPKFHDPSKW